MRVLTREVGLGSTDTNGLEGDFLPSVLRVSAALFCYVESYAIWFVTHHSLTMYFPHTYY
jgi:hypothetical protein